MVGKASRISSQREQRLARIATMYLRHYAQTEIAKVCGVSDAQISRDLVELNARWRAEQLESTHTYKMDALRRIDDLETQYAELYRRSLEPAVTETAKTIDVPLPPRRGIRGSVVAGRDKRTEASRTTEQRVGMKAALDGIAWCIAERAKLLGLYPDQKIRLGAGTGAEPMTFTLELGPARPADDIAGDEPEPEPDDDEGSLDDAE